MKLVLLVVSTVPDQHVTCCVNVRECCSLAMVARRSAMYSELPSLYLDSSSFSCNIEQMSALCGFCDALQQSLHVKLLAAVTVCKTCDRVSSTSMRPSTGLHDMHIHWRTGV